jgi:hypothetical protein
MYTAKEIRDHIHSAADAGKNLYWHRGNGLPNLRIVDAKRRYSIEKFKTIDGKWHDLFLIEKNHIYTN